MNLYNVLLNNEIPFVLLESDDLQNVIYCKSFSDYLFNVGTFVTKTKEVILEYVTEGEGQYIIADVTFENGECYPSVKFQVIINEKVETPYSTINLNLLENKTQVVIPRKPQQMVEDVEETVEEFVPASVPIIETPDYTETINQALKLEKKLNAEKEEIRKQRILLEKQDLIKDKVQLIKDELLEEYFNAVKKQEEIINVSIDKNLSSLEDRLVQTLERYSDQYAEKAEELKSDTKDFIKTQEANILNNLSQKIEHKIDEQKKEIEILIGSELSLTQTEIVNKLEETSQKLVELYKDKTFVMLEQYKQDLLEEYSTVAHQKADDFFNKKGQAINFELKKLTESIEELQLLKDVKKEVIQEVKLYVDEASQSARAYARRILDLGGGGGSVAVQYAEGGTMNGDLNVSNVYPNNANGSLGSPSNRWDKIYANQVDSLSSNIVIELSGFYVDGDFTVNGTISATGGNSNQWNSNYTTTNANSATWSNWSTVSASYALGSQYVKLSGDTMTGTLSVGSRGNLFSPNFATFVKNSAYPTLSSTLINNSGYFDSRGTFASPGGFIIKGHAVDYDNSPKNLPNIGTYGLYIQNVNAFDPGTTFESDGRARVTHAMSFRAGINNFTGGSDHCHVQWQGSPSNSTQAWQMINGGNATNVYGYQFPYTNRFMVHTLPQYQYNTTITAISGFIDTREANRITGTDGVSGVKLLVSRDVGTGNYNLLNVGEVVGLTINPGLVGLVAATYNCQVTQISANAALSSFHFTAYIGNGDNWQPAQKNIQTVSLLSRTNGGNPGVSLVTSQIGTDPSTQYVGLTGSYRGINRHMLARFTSSALLTGYKTGAPLTLWIPPLMPSSSPIGTGIISSDKITTFAQGTFPTGVRSGYFDAYVVSVNGTDLEFSIGNLMDSYSFENRSWPFSASGTAGWLLYGGSQDTVHRPTFGTTGFYFEREPWNVGSVNWLSGGMVKNVVLGTSESYGNFSYGLGWRGVVLGDKSGTFAGDYNTVFGNNSVALGGEGLISLSSTSHQAVVGRYNNPNNNALLVVGAGTNNANRTNILEVEASKVTINGALNTVASISSQSTGFFNHVAAATKSFYIQHPTKPGMHLQYGSLESPYHGVRLTGSGSVKSGDSVVVSLPDYIFSLVHQEGVNIQLTNYQHNKTLFVDDIDVSNNTFTVKCEKKLFDKGEYKFFWSFTAIRKDIPNLQVEC